MAKRTRKPKGNPPLTEEEAVEARGLIAEVEARLLYRMVAAAPIGDIVELGTFQGESTLILCGAAGARPVITIDDYSYQLHSSPAVVRAILKERGMEASVVRGDTRAVPLFVRQVALLFIDSKHERDQLFMEMAAWEPMLMKGAIVVLHDYGSKKWGEMGPAIDECFACYDTWERVGLERRMVAFRFKRGR